MIVGIDASNIRTGGGLTHLVELLRAANPCDFGFDKVVVWGGRATLSKVESRPWLEKVHLPILDKNLIYRAYWQRRHLTRVAMDASCRVLFIPGGAYAGTFKPVVTMSRNLIPFEWRELARYGLSLLTLKWLVLRWTQTNSFQKADGVIFLTHYAKDTVTCVTGPTNGIVDVIPHGIDKRFFRETAPSRTNESKSIGTPLRLVYVSIIDQYKHQWNVAEAVATLRAAGFSVTIDFVGPAYGPALRRLEAVLHRVDPCRQFIRYLGPVAHDDLHRLYHDADICVYASSCENMPNILLEGMAAGLPIACSVRGPMPEILGDAGVYFDPELVDDIYLAIQKLITSPSLRAEKAELAIDRARIYSWARCAGETFNFLAKIAKAEY